MKSLKHYRKYDVTLHDDQSNELLQLVSAISDIGKDELQKVLTKADKRGRGDILRNMWKLDVEERLKFQKDKKMVTEERFFVSTLLLRRLSTSFQFPGNEEIAEALPLFE